MQVTTIGLDIAKNVFQVHGIDAAEKVVVKKQLRRNKLMAFFKKLPPCLIGIEACATAHYWARELTKLGHEVRLMPPKDSQGLPQTQQERCGRRRGNLRGGAAPDDAVRAGQGLLMQHRTRDLLMRQRTQLINALSGRGGWQP
jgi:transposase